MKVPTKALATGVAAVLAIAAPLIAHWEGVRYLPYPDPATGGAPWTVCYGSTKNVVPGARLYQAECDQRLATIWRLPMVVRKCIPVPMLRHVEAACVGRVQHRPERGLR